MKEHIHTNSKSRSKSKNQELLGWQSHGQLMSWQGHWHSSCQETLDHEVIHIQGWLLSAAVEISRGENAKPQSNPGSKWYTVYGIRYKYWLFVPCALATPAVQWLSLSPSHFFWKCATCDVREGHKAVSLNERLTSSSKSKWNSSNPKCNLGFGPAPWPRSLLPHSCSSHPTLQMPARIDSTLILSY